MRLAPCLLSSRQSPVCGGGPCVRPVGRGQLRNERRSLKGRRELRLHRDGNVFFLLK